MLIFLRNFFFFFTLELQRFDGILQMKNDADSLAKFYRMNDEPYEHIRSK